MKIVALIPFWSEYSFPKGSITNRDTVLLGGKPLINYTINLASQITEIDEIIIYSSDRNVTQLIHEKYEYTFLERSDQLDSQEVSIEDIIAKFTKENDADIIVLMHPKHPFLKKETISLCLEKVINKEYESSLLVSKKNKLAWFDNKPLNFNFSEDTPNVSSIEPVIMELSSLYIFTKELFENTRKRADSNSFMLEVGHFEGFEVDRDDDYALAELIVNSGLEY